MRSSGIAGENDRCGIDLEIERAAEQKSECRVHLLDGLGISCAKASGVFNGDCRVTMSGKNLHVVSDPAFAAGDESAAMHPDDGWLRNAGSLQIVEIEGFIRLAAIGDIASGNDTDGNMLF